MLISLKFQKTFKVSFDHHSIRLQDTPLNRSTLSVPGPLPEHAVLCGGYHRAVSLPCRHGLDDLLWVYTLWEGKHCPPIILYDILYAFYFLN